MSANTTVRVALSEEAQPGVVSIIMSALLFSVGTVVVVLNAVTVLLFSRAPLLRDEPCNRMTASLAVTDFCMGIVIVWSAFSWVPIPLISSVVNTAGVSCLIKVCWLCTTVSSSMFHITLLALDRYLYIVLPYLHARLLTPRSTGFLLALIWLLSVIYGTVPAYSNHTAVDKTCDFNAITSVEHYVYAAFGIFVFSCGTTLVFYSLIARVVYRKLRRPLPVPLPRITRYGPLCSSYKIVTRRCQLRHVLLTLRAPVVVFGIFVACWTPHFVAQSVEVVSSTSAGVKYFCATLGLFNSAMNFFVYVVLNPAFRAELVSHWAEKRPRTRVASDSGDRSTN